jgi:hypothetical protein
MILSLKSVLKVVSVKKVEKGNFWVRNAIYKKVSASREYKLFLKHILPKDKRILMKIWQLWVISLETEKPMKELEL